MSRLRSNKVVNQAGTGAPELTYGAVVPATGTISGAGGINVTGIVTAASFSGDGSALSGIDASTLKDGSNTKVQAVSTGANVTGNVAATGNVSASGNVTAVDGTFSGNLTVQGTTTTIDTAVTAVDSLAVDGSVGIGTTNPTAKLSVFTDGVEDSFRIGTPSGSDTFIRLGSTGTDPDTHAVIKYDKEDNYLSLIVSGESHGAGGVLIANGGNVGIKSAIPKTSLDIGSTDAVVVPVGTTGQRPGSAAAGMFRYNSTEGKFEGYTTEWGEIGGGGGGITTEASVASGAVVTLDLTAAQDHKVTASGITTITVSGGTEADSHTVRIINSGITTVGFSTYFLFPSGSTPSLPTADGAISLISFTVNRVGAGGTQLLAGASLNFS